MTPPDAKVSVAVLPLESRTGSPEDDYLTDGVTEDIIIELSKIESLSVIARTSVMPYKGSGKSVAQIAGELGVDTVLTGTLWREGERVRITAALTDPQTNQSLWAHSYDRTPADIFEIRTDVARQIAAALKAELSPADRERLERTEEINPEAYEFYLRGRHERTAREIEENLRKASEYFELALAKQPDFARAWAGLAEVWFLMVGHLLLPREALEPKVREAVERALAIDDTLPEGHVSQGVVRLLWDLDMSGAERSLKSRSGMGEIPRL